MEEISQLKEKVAEELGQYKSSKVNYSQMERDMLYEVAIKLNGILASKSRLKKVELDKESQQLITQQNKVADTKNKLDTTELKTVVQNQITVLSKFVSVLLEKENELSRCVCQKHMQLIHKYENLKLNCKDEILLVPKFEMDSTEKTAQQLKESLNLITSQFEMKEQSMSAKVQSLQQTISMYEQKQEELSGLLKLQIEENKLIQKSLE